MNKLFNFMFLLVSVGYSCAAKQDVYNSNDKKVGTYDDGKLKLFESVTANLIIPDGYTYDKVSLHNPTYTPLWGGVALDAYVNSDVDCKGMMGCSAKLQLVMDQKSREADELYF